MRNKVVTGVTFVVASIIPLYFATPVSSQCQPKGNYFTSPVCFRDPANDKKNENSCEYSTGFRTEYDPVQETICKKQLICFAEGARGCKDTVVPLRTRVTSCDPGGKACAEYCKPSRWEVIPNRFAHIAVPISCVEIEKCRK